MQSLSKKSFGKTPYTTSEKEISWLDRCRRSPAPDPRKRSLYKISAHVARSLQDVSWQNLCTRSLKEICWQDLCRRSLYNIIVRDLIQDLCTRSLQEVSWQDLFFHDFVQKGLAWRSHIETWYILVQRSRLYRDLLFQRS